MENLDKESKIKQYLKLEKKHILIYVFCFLSFVMAIVCELLDTYFDHLAINIFGAIGIVGLIAFYVLHLKESRIIKDSWKAIADGEENEETKRINKRNNLNGAIFYFGIVIAVMHKVHPSFPDLKTMFICVGSGLIILSQILNAICFLKLRKMYGITDYQKRSLIVEETK